MVGPDFSVQLVVCYGNGPISAAASPPTSMKMPAGMVMDGGDSTAPRDHHLGHEDRGSCPYGSAPALGALPTLASLPALLIQRSLELSLATAQLAFVERCESHRRLGYYVSVNGNRSGLGIETPVAQIIPDSENGCGGFGTIIYDATPVDRIRFVFQARHDNYDIPNAPGDLLNDVQR